MSAKVRSMLMIASSLTLILAGGVSGEEPASISTPLPLVEGHDARNGLVSQHPGPTADRVLDSIVRNWHRVKSTVDRFDAEFTVLTYDDVFQVVRIGEGSCATDREGRGFINVNSAKVSRETYNGYTQQPESPSLWWWTGTCLLRIDDRTREYEMLVVPDDDNGRPEPKQPNRPRPPSLPEDVRPNRAGYRPQVTLSSIISGVIFRLMFPPIVGPASVPGEISVRPVAWSTWLMEVPIARVFLVGRPLKELTALYDISLMSQSDTELKLEFTAKQSVRACKKAYLLLDRKSYQVKAMKLFHWSGTKSTVYVFKNARVNQQRYDRLGNLASPNLNGYRRILQTGW